MNRLGARYVVLTRPPRKRRRPRYSKLIVAAVICLNTVFAAAVLCIFRETSVEPVALVTAWFAFTSTELLALAVIKRGEGKREEGGGGSDG